MTKQEMRTRYRALRAALAPEQVHAWGEAICVHVLAHPWVAAAAQCFCYVDAKENEAPTRGIIDALTARGVKVGVPMARAGGTLEWHAFQTWDELGPNRLGILEARPECFRPLVPARGAVCIVPAIAYSPGGHRLGHGGGYYDRFLAGFSGHTIGLCFEACLARDLAVEAHDIAVEAVITEKGAV
ncbi:MAG: 5-formyltetrahydrofolate cyclo-ligase [Candidatus Hydrogenedentes bacterium]|nr:5-formyltetrahydrofolate cyclo-ligase [Candidatus Hydrogenedentota bacterium]